MSERDRLGIRGLVPPAIIEIDAQEEVMMAEFKKGWAARAAQNPDDEILKSGVDPDDIRKWNVLQTLQDRNETLFYKLIMDNFDDMNRIIYTPTGMILNLCHNVVFLNHFYYQISHLLSTF